MFFCFQKNALLLSELQVALEPRQRRQTESSPYPMGILRSTTTATCEIMRACDILEKNPALEIRGYRVQSQFCHFVMQIRVNCLLLGLVFLLVKWEHIKVASHTKSTVCAWQRSLREKYQFKQYSMSISPGVSMSWKT